METVFMETQRSTQADDMLYGVMLVFSTQILRHVQLNAGQQVTLTP